MRNFLEDNTIIRVKDAVAEGQTAVTTDTVDTLGCNSVTFIVAVGSIATDCIPSLSVEQSADDSTYNALLGTKSTVLADTDDTKLLAVEVIASGDRYLQCVVTRTGGATGCVIDGIIAIKSHNAFRGVTQGATVGSSETHSSPAEGAI